MGIVEKILQYQLENDLYYDQDKMVRGIAERAIDKGYNSLSEKQKNVLSQFLKIKCDGVMTPAGERENCKTTLQEQELLNAYENKFEEDDILCESCLSQRDYFNHQWEKISQE